MVQSRQEWEKGKADIARQQDILRQKRSDIDDAFFRLLKNARDRGNVSKKDAALIRAQESYGKNRAFKVIGAQFWNRSTAFGEDFHDDGERWSRRELEVAFEKQRRADRTGFAKDFNSSTGLMRNPPRNLAESKACNRILKGENVYEGERRACHSSYKEYSRMSAWYIRRLYAFIDAGLRNWPVPASYSTYANSTKSRKRNTFPSYIKILCGQSSPKIPAPGKKMWPWKLGIPKADCFNSYKKFRNSFLSWLKREKIYSKANARNPALIENYFFFYAQGWRYGFKAPVNRAPAPNDKDIAKIGKWWSADFKARQASGFVKKSSAQVYKERRLTDEGVLDHGAGGGMYYGSTSDFFSDEGMESMDEMNFEEGGATYHGLDESGEWYAAYTDTVDPWDDEAGLIEEEYGFVPEIEGEFGDEGGLINVGFNEDEMFYREYVNAVEPWEPEAQAGLIEEEYGFVPEVEGEFGDEGGLEPFPNYAGNRYGDNFSQWDEEGGGMGPLVNLAADTMYEDAGMDDEGGMEHGGMEVEGYQHAGMWEEWADPLDDRAEDIAELQIASMLETGEWQEPLGGMAGDDLYTTADFMSGWAGMEQAGMGDQESYADQGWDTSSIDEFGNHRVKFIPQRYPWEPQAGMDGEYTVDDFDADHGGLAYLEAPGGSGGGFKYAMPDFGDEGGLIVQDPILGEVDLGFDNEEDVGYDAGRAGMDYSNGGGLARDFDEALTDFGQDGGMGDHGGMSSMQTEWDYEDELDMDVAGMMQTEWDYEDELDMDVAGMWGDEEDEEDLDTNFNHMAGLTDTWGNFRRHYEPMDQPWEEGGGAAFNETDGDWNQDASLQDWDNHVPFAADRFKGAWDGVYYDVSDHAGMAHGESTALVPAGQKVEEEEDMGVLYDWFAYNETKLGNFAWANPLYALPKGVNMLFGAIAR